MMIPPGIILQTQESVYVNTSSVSVTTATPAALGASVSITPKKSTSKIEVVFNFSLFCSATAIYYHVYRDGVALSEYKATVSGAKQSASGAAGNNGGNDPMPLSVEITDDPGDTAAHTYELRFTANSAGTLYLNRTQTDADNNNYSRFASWASAKEISQ